MCYVHTNINFREDFSRKWSSTRTGLFSAFSYIQQIVWRRSPVCSSQQSSYLQLGTSAKSIRHATFIRLSDNLWRRRIRKDLSRLGSRKECFALTHHRHSCYVLTAENKVDTCGVVPWKARFYGFTILTRRSEPTVKMHGCRPNHEVISSSSTSKAQQKLSLPIKITPLPSGAQRRSLVSKFSGLHTGRYEV